MLAVKLTILFELFEPAFSFPLPQLLHFLLLQVSKMLLLQTDVLQFLVPDFFLSLLRQQELLDFLFLFGRIDSAKGILISSAINLLRLFLLAF